MASAFIDINGTATRINGELRSLLNQLQAVQDDAGRLKGIFDQIALDSDWASLAAALGISEANAETVYNLLGSVNTELNASFISQALSRLG